MIMNSIFKISELLSVHSQKSELERKEIELVIPLLTDEKYIPQIFEWFCELSDDCNDCTFELDTDNKMKFLVIILFLYSPAFFTGHRLKNGIRDILTELFGYKSRSGVSNHLKDIVHIYNTYKMFREEVYTLYGEIEKRLKDRGLIP